MPKITAGMRERLGSLVSGALSFARRPGELDDQMGCGATWAILIVGIVIIMATMFLTGVIDYDFSLTPAERGAGAEPSGDSAPPGTATTGEPGSPGTAPTGDSASDAPLEDPGPPYMDGRHYAIFGQGETGERRAYTFELMAEGDSGALRVWEDETGTGTFTIIGDVVTVEMQRMVPPEAHEIREPNVFSGTMAADQSEFSGTWRVQGWGGLPGEVELAGEWSEIPFVARRL